MEAYGEKIENQKVCAGIILYEPDIARLCENIESVASQTDSVIIVDNNSSLIREIMELISNSFSTPFIWILNGKNEGIAFALNQIIDEAVKLGFSWVITLDQDSVCGKGLVSCLLSVAETDPAIAMVSPYIVDINICAIEQYRAMELPCIEDVPMCITSGCLTSVPAALGAGGFNNSLFIDQVDHEMCIRLRLAGYRIVRANRAHILHAVGNRRELRFMPRLAKTSGSKWLSRPKYIFNHPPVRVYYQTRNLIWLLRAYPGCMGTSNSEYWVRYCRGVILKLIKEPHKIKKLAAFIHGVKDGIQPPGNLKT